MKRGSDLTLEQRAELAALRELPDDQIDLSDAPEVTDWSGARRGVFFKPVKRQLTLRLDADLIHYFKSQGDGYQTRINAALREFMERRGGRA